MNEPKAQAPRCPHQAGGPTWSGIGYVALGAVALAVLIGGVGAWAASAQLAGAVVALGTVKVESRRQIVQHPDGGVVEEMFTSDGQRVRQGQVLLRFDGTLKRAERTLVHAELMEARARAARLQAERAGRPEMMVDQELVQAAREDQSVVDLIAGQKNLLTARRESWARETAQLRERQKQVSDEIDGLQAQKASAIERLAITAEELQTQERLLKRGLTQKNRVTTLKRQRAELKGEIGALTARIAGARGRSTEIEVQIVRRDAERVETAITQLRDITAQIRQLVERRRTLDEVLSRLEVRAPRDGVVIETAVTTARAVVRPADPILQIVPSDGPLVVETQVAPRDIDRVFRGQDAMLRFSAFNARLTPEIEGHVTDVSADALDADQPGRPAYYLVRVGIAKEQIAELGSVELVPGMPVEAFLATAPRTPLSYLIKPLTDYFQRALQED